MKERISVISMERTISIFIMAIVAIIITINSVLRLLDSRKREMTVEFLGSNVASIDIFIDIVMIVFSIFLIVGYINMLKWAYKGTFYYWAIYFFGKIVGLVISIFYLDRILEYSSMIKFGEIREFPFPGEFVIYTGITVIIFQVIFVGIGLKVFSGDKKYFVN